MLKKPGIKTFSFSFFRKKSWILILGIMIGIVLFSSLYQTSVYFSTNESCMICHVHPHVEESWKKSVHVNNPSGVAVSCVACHLPPITHTRAHYTEKVKMASRDIWGYLTKDSADFDWEKKSLLENAVKYIPNSSCVGCHQNIFPIGISAEGITAHLHYEKNQAEFDLQCISCHLDVGHYNPNYSGNNNAISLISRPSDQAGALFSEPTQLLTFEHFTENIPQTTVSISMKAIPGGTFNMGSPSGEPFRRDDEGPVREVTISPFYMSETEVTWEQYLAFYNETMSEGRIPPHVVYANNQNLGPDGITGPTPPYGNVHQGWGLGTNPAITMTPYAAEVFCIWLSNKTGKNYRLPTEAEWEYAARAGTNTPYFFEGNPKEFSNQSFWRMLFKAQTSPIGDYVYYANNSSNKTGKPENLRPNAFGLKNMLGNVAEYCADKYNKDAYSATGLKVNDPVETNGEEFVIRGGNYASDAADVRSAARDHTKSREWLISDPQQPQSIWWYSNIRGVGFRVVCDP